MSTNESLWDPTVDPYKFMGDVGSVDRHSGMHGDAMMFVGMQVLTNHNM